MERRSVLLLTTATALLFGASSPALLPASAAPPTALLAVSAPTTPDVRALGSWYDLHVPSRFHARQTVSVSLLNSPEMSIYLESDGSQGGGALDNDGDIDGVFENDPPSITLRLPAGGVPDDLTFAHEYGHYVWFDLLSGSDRKRYTAIYERQKALHCLVTEYAGDCVEEGFAEAFAYYAGQPATLARRDTLSYAFLAQWPGR